MLLSSAPPSSPTPCPSALAAEAAAGLVAERRAASPGGPPERVVGAVREPAARPAMAGRGARRRAVAAAHAAAPDGATGQGGGAAAQPHGHVRRRARRLLEDQHARRCVRGLRETFADALAASRARAAPLVLVFNFESNRARDAQVVPDALVLQAAAARRRAPAADAANDILFPRYYLTRTASGARREARRSASTGCRRIRGRKRRRRPSFVARRPTSRASPSPPSPTDGTRRVDLWRSTRR